MTELLRGVSIVAHREVLLFVSDRARIAASLAFPILFLVIFGAGFGGIVGRMADQVDLLQFMYPGIVAQAVLITSLFAGVSVVADRESGFLREILVAPLSRTGIVLGKALGAAGVASLQVLLLLVLAPFVGVRLTPAIVLQLVPIAVVCRSSCQGSESSSPPTCRRSTASSCSCRCSSFRWSSSPACSSRLTACPPGCRSCRR
jgi:ABC-2 type transport system permease protein